MKRATLFCIVFAVCLLLDHVTYHVASALGVKATGVVTMLWLLWFVHLLLEEQYGTSIAVSLIVAAVVTLLGIHGFVETLCLLWILIVFSSFFHAWMMTTRLAQQNLFVALNLGLYIGLRIGKMAFEMTDPLLYLLQVRWLVVFVFNVGVYALIAKAIFDRAFGSIERRCSIYA